MSSILLLFRWFPWQVWAGLAAAILLLGAYWRITDAAYDRGRADLAAEQYRNAMEKNDAANRADDAARRCALDPACRLQDDGWRRD